MARTTTPLTNTQVKQSKPTDKRQKLSDGGGLQLCESIRSEYLILIEQK